MRYVEARFKQTRRDNLYRIYVTDALFAIANGGLSLTTRYCDLIDPKPEKPKDNRTQEEIVAQVWRSIIGGD